MLRSYDLEIMNMVFGSKVVSVKIPALGIFSSTTEEDISAFSSWGSYAYLRYFIFIKYDSAYPSPNLSASRRGREDSAFNI